MQKRILNLTLALGLVTALLAGAVCRAGATPIGWHTYDVSGCGLNQMSEDEVIRFYQQSGGDLVKVFLGSWGCQTPVQTERLINETNIQTVIIRTDDGPGGYNYQYVRDQVETPRDGRSWGDVMRAHPELDWWIEVGNEPNYHFEDPWSPRWWGLAIYKELALNHLGHVDQAWRTKYPMLRWAFSMNVGGTSLASATDYAGVLMQYSGGLGLGDGGVLDYYDAVGVHLYGAWSLRDPGTSHYWVEQKVLNDPYHDLVLYSEAGIWEGDDGSKVAAYRDFMTSKAPAETAGFVSWLLGRGTAWPEFELDDQNLGHYMAVSQ